MFSSIGMRSPLARRQGRNFCAELIAKTGTHARSPTVTDGEKISIYEVLWKMTVAELIAILQKMPQEVEVIVWARSESGPPLPEVEPEREGKVYL